MFHQRRILSIAFSSCMALLLLLAVFSPYAIPAARASTFTVTKTADTNDGVCDADCSLREAIIAANATDEADTITLGAGTYTLSIAGINEDYANTGDLDLTKPVTIIGAGTGQTIIDAAQIDRVFDLRTGVGSVAFQDLTIRGGSATLCTGIFSRSTQLTLTDVIVRNNSATSGSGGGLCTGSLSTLVRTTFQENSSTANGGAIYNGSGQIDLQDGAIIDNTAYQGGGVYIDTEPAKLTQTGATLFSGNITDSHGGALYLDEGDATLDGANFTGNHAYRGGAAWVETEDSLLTLTNGRIEGNTVDEDGAGIYVNNGTAELTRSAIVGNQANNIGGGLYNAYGTIRLINVTVSGNDAQVNTSVGGGGGGIFLGGSSIYSSVTELNFVTLTQNTARIGADGMEEANGIARVQNSIIADNGEGNCDSGVISLGHNIDSGNTCLLDATGDLVNTDPALAPLAADGTHPLQSTSPAIDQGLCIAGITTDQRGTPRPQGAGCDIGAYELAPVAVSGVSISGPTSGVTGEDYSFTASVTPADATGPITYTWSPVPQSGQGTHTATYQWDTAGNYNITVTATNNIGEATSAPHAITISEPPPVALIGVSIAGPTHGGVGIDYTFTATVAPNNATTPITYTWTPTPLSGQGTQSATYQWAAPGDYSITVTAENSVGQIISDPHNITITLEAPSYPVYLPLTLRP